MLQGDKTREICNSGSSIFVGFGGQVLVRSTLYRLGRFFPTIKNSTQEV